MVLTDAEALKETNDLTELALLEKAVVKAAKALPDKIEARDNLQVSDAEKLLMFLDEDMSPLADAVRALLQFEKEQNK